jgi:hypothetical protein
MTPEEAEAKYVNRMILTSFGIPIVEVRGEMSKRSMYNWVPQFTKANIEQVDPIARRMYYHDGKETEVGRIEVRWLTNTMGQVYFKGHIASLINLLKEFVGISATNVNKRFENIEKYHNVMPRISVQKELPIELSKMIRAGVGPSVLPKNDPGYALARGISKRKNRMTRRGRTRRLKGGGGGPSKPANRKGSSLQPSLRDTGLFEDNDNNNEQRESVSRPSVSQIVQTRREVPVRSFENLRRHYNNTTRRGWASTEEFFRQNAEKRERKREEEKRKEEEKSRIATEKQKELDEYNKFYNDVIEPIVRKEHDMYIQINNRSELSYLSPEIKHQ